VWCLLMRTSRGDAATLAAWEEVEREVGSRSSADDAFYRATRAWPRLAKVAAEAHDLLRRNGSNQPATDRSSCNDRCCVLARLSRPTTFRCGRKSSAREGGALTVDGFSSELSRMVVAATRKTDSAYIDGLSGRRPGR
jgi:hypothetical protein